MLSLTTKQKKGKRVRLNVNRDHDVGYGTKEFGINADNLREVVADVGPIVSDVRKQ